MLTTFWRRQPKRFEIAANSAEKRLSPSMARRPFTAELASSRASAGSQEKLLQDNAGENAPGRAEGRIVPNPSYPERHLSSVVRLMTRSFLSFPGVSLAAFAEPLGTKRHY